MALANGKQIKLKKQKPLNFQGFLIEYFVIYDSLLTPPVFALAGRATCSTAFAPALDKL